MKKRTIRSIAILLIATLVLTMMPLNVFGASNKLSKPKITSTKVDAANVTIRWGKVKNAREYYLAMRADKKSWVKYKTVKKTKKNRKKYTKPNKYKVVAKGKKYKVYKYTYKYVTKAIVNERSYKFTGLMGNTNYSFAVRAANGKKHSAWRKVKVKTKLYSQSIKINGKSIKVTQGVKTKLPFPNIPGISIAKKSFDIIPEQDENYPFYDKEDGGIRVGGKSSAGFAAYYVYTRYDNSFAYRQRKYESRDAAQKYGMLSYGSKFMSWPEVYSITINKDNMKAVWTLDGTEPKLGQEDKYIDASDYPFGKWTKGDTVQLRGTTTSSYEIPETKWTDSKGYGIKRSAPIVVWAKLYYNNTLIDEYIEIDMQ